MAISSYKVFLMHKVEGQWEKLVDIKSFPDLGGDPEMLETTTLSDPMQTNIPGIQSLDALEFTCNYDLDDYKKLKALAHKDEEYAVWLGGVDSPTGGKATPNGSDGKYKFNGSLSVYPVGGDVNTVVDMKVTIASSTPIELDEGE